MTPTKHAADCRMAFGRKDPSCPRCQELLAGAPPRDGWQKAYYAKRCWCRDNPTTSGYCPRCHHHATGRQDDDTRRLAAYCWCPDTPISKGRCDRCGKPPYTD